MQTPQQNPYDPIKEPSSHQWFNEKQIIALAESEVTPPASPLEGKEVWQWLQHTINPDVSNWIDATEAERLLHKTFYKYRTFMGANNIDTRIKRTPTTLLSESKEAEPLPTTKYRHFNHHHDLTDEQEVVNFGDGEFIANKAAIPLLKALNELGLRTRTHHVDNNGGFVSILLSDKISIEVKQVYERDAERTKYNGLTELLINWTNEKSN